MRERKTPTRAYLVEVWAPKVQRVTAMKIVAAGPIIAAGMARRRAGARGDLPFRLYDVPAYIRTERVAEPHHCPAIRYYHWNGRMLDFHGFDPPGGWPA